MRHYYKTRLPFIKKALLTIAMFAMVAILASVYFFDRKAATDLNYRCNGYISSDKKDAAGNDISLNASVHYFNYVNHSGSFSLEGKVSSAEGTFNIDRTFFYSNTNFNSSGVYSFNIDSTSKGSTDTISDELLSNFIEINNIHYHYFMSARNIDPNLLLIYKRNKPLLLCRKY